MRQCDPSIIDIKKKINNQIIKAPFYGTLNYTGDFINTCAHFFVLFDFLMGGLKKIEKIPNSSAYMKVEDFRFYFQKGVVDFVKIRFKNFSINEIKLYSKNGCLETNGQFGQITWTKFKKSNIYRELNVLSNNSTKYSETGKKAMLYVAQHLYNEILGKKSNLTSLKKSNSIMNSVQNKLENINVKV